MPAALLAQEEIPAAAAMIAPHMTPVVLERHTAGTFYVDGALQGYGDLRLLVDTGSSHMVINEAMLEMLKKSGNATFVRQTRGVMADGSPRGVPIYRLAALRIGDSCWVREVEAAIIPGNVRPILGMNVLARLSPFTFSAEPAQINLQRCEADAEAAAFDAGQAGSPVVAADARRAE
ncbi:MAG TPA: retropepsin-like aspartic protease [Candidatus Binatia bacterium]|nr:retropepsin-like aspartic protease [Candidatus Binatia bacterium]